MVATCRRVTPPSVHTRPRRPAFRRRAVAATMVAGALLLASCMNADQQNAYDLVNAARAGASRPALHHDATAQAKAQAWAEHLAATNSLAHSRLTDGMDNQWTKLAENVGAGSSIEAVHRQFMRSSSHRANILDQSLTHLGTGVARGHGKTFVVQVFSRR